VRIGANRIHAQHVLDKLEVGLVVDDVIESYDQKVQRESAGEQCFSQSREQA
jgi:hypothetical protein